MPEKHDGPWLVPPERAQTRRELAMLAQDSEHGFRQMRIGEVAERIGLSMRSIRYYEEAGLVRPSARTPGGFRLYTEPDVHRLLLVMQMKPLGFSLDEMRVVFSALDALPQPPGADATSRPSDGTSPAQDPAPHDPARELADVLQDVEGRLTALRKQVDIAESFRLHLRQELGLEPA